MKLLGRTWAGRGSRTLLFAASAASAVGLHGGGAEGNEGQQHTRQREAQDRGGYHGVLWVEVMLVLPVMRG